MDLVVQVPVPRSVTIDGAKLRMEKLLPRMQEQFGAEVPITNIEVAWDGYVAAFSFKAKGYAIAGTMEVGHNFVTLESRLSFFVSFYHDKIEQAVKENALALLTANTAKGGPIT